MEPQEVQTIVDAVVAVMQGAAPHPLVEPSGDPHCGSAGGHLAVGVRCTGEGVAVLCECGKLTAFFDPATVENAEDQAYAAHAATCGGK